MSALRTLIDAGAKLNKKDSFGSTPLHSAAAAGQGAAVDALLEAGADATAVNKAGWGTLHFAATHGEASVQIVKSLLQYGADATISVQQGIRKITPLYRAITAGHLGTVTALLDHTKPGEATPTITCAHVSELHVGLADHNVERHWHKAYMCLFWVLVHHDAGLRPLAGRLDPSMAARMQGWAEPTLSIVRRWDASTARFTDHFTIDDRTMGQLGAGNLMEWLTNTRSRVWAGSQTQHVALMAVCVAAWRLHGVQNGDAFSAIARTAVQEGHWRLRRHVVMARSNRRRHK